MSGPGEPSPDKGKGSRFNRFPNRPQWPGSSNQPTNTGSSNAGSWSNYSSDTGNTNHNTYAADAGTNVKMTGSTNFGNVNNNPSPGSSSNTGNNTSTSKAGSSSNANPPQWPASSNQSTRGASNAGTASTSSRNAGNTNVNGTSSANTSVSTTTNNNNNNAKSNPLKSSFSAGGAQQTYESRRQPPDLSRARARTRSDSSDNVPELQAEDPPATGNWSSGSLDFSPLYVIGFSWSIFIGFFWPITVFLPLCVSRLLIKLVKYLFGILLTFLLLVSVAIAALSATGAVTNLTTAGLLRIIFGLAGRLLASVGSSVVFLARNNDGSSATSFFRQLPRYNITHISPSHGGLLEKASAQAYVLRQAHGNLVVLSWGSSEDGLVDVFEVTEMAKVIHRNFVDTMLRYDVCHEEWGNDVRGFVFQLTGLGTALHAQHDAWESEVAALGVDDHDWASAVWLKMTSLMPPFSGGGRKNQLDRLQALVAYTEKLSNHLVQHETELQNYSTCFSNTKKDLGIVNGQVVKAREAVLLL